MLDNLHKPKLMDKPGPRLRKYIPLRFVRGNAHGKKSTYAELNITSMVDMLMILTVFLLMTFSASGELLQVQKNIILPKAQNFHELEQAPVVAISRDAVTLDGKMVADASVLNQDNTADWKIVELHDTLVVLKNNYTLLHPDKEWKGLVIVQADKGVDFKIIKKVMYSASLAGYQNVNFAVQEKPKGG